MKSLKCDVSLFSKLFISCQNRHLDLDTFFTCENQSTPPSLSSMGSIRTCQKSEIVKILKKTLEGDTHSPPENCSRHIYDGAALVHSHPPRTSKTFGEYCRTEFRQSFVRSTGNNEARRTDLVWDLYSEKSLKKHVRDNRGTGVRCQVRDSYKLPRNWSDFLKNDKNKEELFELLGSYALQNAEEQQIVTNVGHKIIASVAPGTSINGLNTDAEEADGRILLHAKDMVLNGASRIMIHTVDSDVVVIAISFFLHFSETVSKSCGYLSVQAKTSATYLYMNWQKI